MSSASNASGWLRRRKYPRIITCDQADIDRTKALWWDAFTSATLLFLSWAVTAWHNNVTLSIVTGLAGLASILHIPVAVDHRRALRRAHEFWRHTEGATLFFPDRSIAIAEYVFFGMVFLAGAAGIGLVWFMQLTQTPIGSTVRGTVFFSSIAVSLATASWRKTPFTLRPSPALALTHHGIHIWPGTRHETFIYWENRPQVTKVVSYQLLIITTASAVITCYRLGREFPMGSLPMEYNQLRRVVEFYTRHRRLRHELAKPEGLERVRSLMQHPVWEIEEQLPPPKPKRPRRHRK
ncbi:hypothetical protein [Actinomyces qiguomingii]|uniref:hypothetical protein n=2 Tax=Actinomyces qiguomingii TaxID=2057800 RepID=UPI000FFE83B3|nr:hypothetical protein [Actinomyces qiguomingii]